MKNCTSAELEMLDQIKQRRDKEWDHLCDKFPVLTNKLPLEIGVFEELATHLKYTTKTQLRKLMHWHTTSPGYLKNLSTMSVRFNPDSTKASAVSKEHKQHAINRLKQYKRKSQIKPAKIAPMASSVITKKTGAIAMGLRFYDLDD